MELEFIEHISPKLKEGVKNYLIDIDGTITDCLLYTSRCV